MKKKEENYISELISIIKLYKWSILFITIFFFSLAMVYLFFQPLIYEAYAIIKVKSESGDGRQFSTDPLSDALAISHNTDIEQELAILRTFYINDKVIDRLASRENFIDRVNLRIQYFQKKGYKEIEIFSEFPIEIKDVEIIDKAILGKKVKLISENDGFRIKLNENEEKVSQIYRYGELVKNNKFKIRVTKNSNFHTPILFKLNGDNRNIYEKIVKKNLQVSQLNKNVPLIKISYHDTSSDRATKYIQALLEVYIEQSISSKSRKNNKILNFINEQLKMVGKKLELSENELETYRISNSVIEPSVQSRTAINRLSEIEVEVSEYNMKMKLVKNLTNFVKKNKNLNSITPTLRELEDESSIKLVEKLQTLNEEANELSKDFTEKHPDLKAIRKSIRKTKRNIISNIEQLKKNIFNKIRELKKLKKKYEENLKRLPTKEKKLIDLKRKYEVNAKMYSYLLEKKSENEMKKVATISDYEIIDSPYSSGRPIKPKRLQSLLIFTIFGFVFAVLLSVYRNSTIKKIRNTKDIEKFTTLPIYGKTSTLLDFYRKRGILNNHNSPTVISFRNLRTNIQFNSKKERGNIILVTSSVPKEGKSIVSLNLGVIFQMANYKSILIDLNLYQPTLHKRLDIENSIGISDYLRGNVRISDIIENTSSEKLDFIPAGSISSNAPELILSKKFSFLLEKLKTRYDYIFIDSASFKIMADILYLMQYADITLLIVRKEFTKKGFLIKLEETVKERNFKEVGIFFNEEKKR